MWSTPPKTGDKWVIFSGGLAEVPSSFTRSLVDDLHGNDRHVEVIQRIEYAYQFGLIAEPTGQDRHKRSILLSSQTNFHAS